LAHGNRRAAQEQRLPAGFGMKSLTIERPLGAEPTRARAARDAIRITVMGTGHVGLVSAACFARFGHQVTAFDIDAGRIERLMHGEPTLHEDGLSELLREQLAAQRLRFSHDAALALADADIVFVAVGTPARADGSIEMGAIEAVVDCLRTRVRAGGVVVLKSTVPVGTAQRIQAELANACDADATPPRVLGNPEFLREGCAIADFMQPDRLIVGDDAPDSPARRLLLRVYAPLVEAGVPVLAMDTRSAELAKCAANAMLAARISFVNEIAAIAAATGADIEQVCRGIGSDRRIGSDFLRPGLGYGGSCFPKDVAALRETARRSNLRSDMLLATERVNNRQRCWAFEALQRDIGSRSGLRGLRAAIWGLAFKPGTDDVREAPSLTLIDRLCRAGVSVNLYDPVAMRNARACLGTSRRIAWASSATAALRKADVLLLVTEWPEFVAFDPGRVAAALALRAVYDGRNALDATAWCAAGLRLVQVGRADAGAAPIPGWHRATPRGTRAQRHDVLAAACG
jgi:UDPglucose 6-dehydrogenase